MAVGKIWACWIAENGRSYYKKPQAVRESDETPGEYWHKDGNDFLRITDGFDGPKIHGGFTFASTDKSQVALVIETSEKVLKSIANSWGLEDRK